MNKYSIIGCVGEGSYGVVLKCREKDNGTFVAIKKFRSSEDDPIFVRTSVREVKILRTLRHPNIVRLQDVFKRNGKLYLVFEFVDKNLLEVLHGNYPSGFESNLLRSTVLQIIRGIEYCHKLQVIHRDIKPENILMNMSDLSVKICDFGFARPMMIGSQAPLTDYVATRWYRAPELLLGSLSYGTGIDIFAIGCIMAELADGEPLLPGDSEVSQLAIISKVIGPIPPKLSHSIPSNRRAPVLLGNGSVDHPDIDDRFLTRLSFKAVRCLRHMVEVDPDRRVSASKAIEDPYFQQPESSLFSLPTTTPFR